MFNVEELKQNINDAFKDSMEYMITEYSDDVIRCSLIEAIQGYIIDHMLDNNIAYHRDCCKYLWFYNNDIYYIIMTLKISSSDEKYIIYTKAHHIFSEYIEEIFIEQMDEIPGDILTENSILIGPGYYFYKDDLYHNILYSTYQDILQMVVWYLLENVRYDKTVLPPDMNMTSINDFYEKELNKYLYDDIFNKPIKDAPRVYIMDGEKIINIDSIYDTFKNLKE